MEHKEASNPALPALAFIRELSAVPASGAEQLGSDPLLARNAGAFVGLAHRLATSLDPGQTAELATELTLEMLGASLVALYVKQPDGSLAAAASAGSWGRHPAPSVVQRALSIAAPAVAHAAELEELAVSDGEAIALPVTSQGAPLGVLLAALPEGQTVARSMTLVAVVADLVAASLANANRFAQTFAEARRDPLTGLGNHRAFHERLDALLRDAISRRQEVSLLLFDLDDFVLINDRYGHLAGDETLRRLARVAVGAFPEEMEIFRVGGEEFAIVAQGDPQTAHEVADRLRRIVAEKPLYRDVSTLSVGVATFPADARTRDELVHKADLACHAAKQGGKNTVVVYGRDLVRAGRSSLLAAREQLRERLADPAIRSRIGSDLGTVSAVLSRLGRAETPHELFDSLCRELTALLDATTCTVSRLEGDILRETVTFGRPLLTALDEYGYLLDDYPLTRRVLETDTSHPVSLADDDPDPAEAFVLREVGMEAVLMVPLSVLGKAWGLVELYDERPRRFEAADIGLAELVVANGASVLSQFEQEEAVQRIYRETIAALANALEAKDVSTGRHAQSVSELAAELAARLGLSGRDLQTVELGALLHDIGKIEVPDAILTKSGPLSEQEWEIIRAHPQAGARILEPISSLADVLPLIRFSHERWDGRGYPTGLAGEGIPLGARIVSVCDAFCTMVEGRPYRKRVDADIARDELQRRAGRQFDPTCVAALLDVLDERERQRGLRLHRPEGHAGP